MHLPVSATGASKGFALVMFAEPSSAVTAFQNADGRTFQGRLLHVIPAKAKRETKLDEFAIAKLPLKKQQQVRKKAEAASNTFNWNSLYMDQSAVNASVAARVGLDKSELFDHTSSDALVQQAIAETTGVPPWDHAFRLSTNRQCYSDPGSKGILPSQRRRSRLFQGSEEGRYVHPGQELSLRH